MFNSEITDDMNQAIFAIELLNEAIEKISKRIELLEIADKSEIGRDTIKQYVVNTLASD